MYIIGEDLGAVRLGGRGLDAQGAGDVDAAADVLRHIHIYIYIYIYTYYIYIYTYNI